MLTYPHFGRHLPLPPSCWVIRVAAGGYGRQLVVLDLRQLSNASKRSENISSRAFAFLTLCNISSCVSLLAVCLGVGSGADRLVTSLSTWSSGDSFPLNNRQPTEHLVVVADLFAATPPVSGLEIPSKSSLLSSPMESTTDGQLTTGHGDDP